MNTKRNLKVKMVFMKMIKSNYLPKMTSNHMNQYSMTNFTPNRIYVLFPLFKDNRANYN